MDFDHAKAVIEGVCAQMARERSGYTPAAPVAPAVERKPAPLPATVAPAAPVISARAPLTMTASPASRPLQRAVAGRKRWPLGRCAVLLCLIVLGYQGYRSSLTPAARTSAKGAAAANAEVQSLRDGELLPVPPEGRIPALHDLTREERKSLELVCAAAKATAGSSSHAQCVDEHLLRFEPAQRPKGLAALTDDEIHTLASACQKAKQGEGPAGYNHCLNRQLREFDSRPRQPALVR